MDLIDLIAAFIETEECTSVRDQFVESYENSDFDEQNQNALELIQLHVRRVLKKDLLKNTEELQHYLEDLNSYLEHS